MNPGKKERLLQNEIIRDRAGSVLDLLGSIGEDPARDGLLDTPLRVAAMYEELFAGYKIDPDQLLKDAMFVEAGKKSLVLVKDIPFYSCCEHHMATFFGTASIAYIPQDGRIVGLSKLARVVDAYARRLQVQERLGNEILGCINRVMNPFGAAVILQARHMCVESRGVQKPGTITVTSALEGVFYLDEKARAELMQLVTWHQTL